MNRRKFIAHAAAGLGATCLAPRAIADLLVLDSPHRVEATDTVVLGKTGIHTSRLARAQAPLVSEARRTRPAQVTSPVCCAPAMIGDLPSLIPPIRTDRILKWQKLSRSFRATRSSS
jgi:hypothetical protein